jgi:glycosyltransferase involved in cell wall biosynthesis
MTAPDPNWVCCQLGAREHYAVPRALQLRGLLRELITDLWIRPATLLNSSRNRLTGRFHPGLSEAQVTAPNVAALTFALRSSATGAAGWDLISKRNDWFQRRVVEQLARRHNRSGPQKLFAYSYAAELILKFARERGWRTVLGQIDPGPADERIVAGLHTARQNGWRPAPREYWDRWRNECELADQIVVNSGWSRDALLSEGIAAEKIRVIPVAFEPDAEAEAFGRSYPAAFTRERPLRVLFLGQIGLRKGVRQLFDAMKLLSTEPIEFWFVGPLQVEIPHQLKEKIRWFGVVPRAKASQYYRDADVFILPTLSDGFGLTQLEAQSWQLPVIASRYCGDVVQDGFNGLLLEEVSGSEIADKLRRLLCSSECLSAMSENSRVDDRFSLNTLAASLSSL